MVVDFILNAIFASVASVGFAMVFNVPRRYLLHCALGGSITLSLRNILLSFGFSIELSVFLASITIGYVALYWSKKYNSIRSTYTVASIIPIIPGTIAIKSMTLLMQMNSHGVNSELLNAFLENGLKSMSILGAMSFGIALPSILSVKVRKSII